MLVIAYIVVVADVVDASCCCWLLLILSLVLVFLSVYSPRDRPRKKGGYQLAVDASDC